MAKFDLEQAVSDVYEKAESMYKGSEITADIMEKIARKYFDFTDSQVNSIVDYVKEQEQYYMLEDVDADESSNISSASNKIDFDRAETKLGEGRSDLNKMLENNELTEMQRDLITQAISKLVEAEKILMEVKF